MAFSKVEQFDNEAQQLARIAKALGHPARIAILRLLAKKDNCVCGDIVEELPLSQSTVSQHLKALKEVGLIQGNVEGVKVCYCLDGGVCAVVKKLFGGLFKQLEDCSCCQ